MRFLDLGNWSKTEDKRGEIMTYNYKCEDCDKEFVIEKGINDNREIKCEFCNGDKVKRVFVPITPIWKCSGAYGKSK